MNNCNIFYALVVGVMVLVGITEAKAGTLENLERERAITMSKLISPSISLEDRQIIVEQAVARLVDLERIVLRDASLRGKDTPDVRRAFQNYDLTFLLHASVEHDHSIVDHWLDQLGINTQTLMSARMGRR